MEDETASKTSHEMDDEDLQGKKKYDIEFFFSFQELKRL